MQKRFIPIPFFTALLLYSVLNLVIFLGVDSLRLDSTVFWISWTLAFPVQLAILAFFGFFARWQSAFEKPLVYVSVVGGALAYLAAGLVFMLAATENTTAFIITEAALTAVYLAFLLFSSHSVKTVREAEDSRLYTAGKVGFIRMLTADVEDAMSRAADPKVKDALLELSEQIRFSDPMSSGALESCESRISEMIFAISEKAKDGDSQELIDMINEVSRLVEDRNRRCKLLK